MCISVHPNFVFFLMYTIFLSPLSYNIVHGYIQLEVSGRGAENFLESLMVADLQNLDINTGIYMYIHLSMHMYTRVILPDYISIYV